MPSPERTGRAVARQRIWVFQQQNSAAGKIAGISQYCSDAIELTIYSIDDPLPPIIDDPSPWLPDSIAADLVLDHLKHPDLSQTLAELCRQADVPVIASGKKGPAAQAHLPPTCCALKEKDDLGHYGRRFGQPELTVDVKDGMIASVSVERGSPCGATWQAAEKIVGLATDQAHIRYGLETQYFCVADPAGWDPISGKSPVHIAGDLHKYALRKALKKAGAACEDD